MPSEPPAAHRPARLGLLGAHNLAPSSTSASLQTPGYTMSQATVDVQKPHPVSIVFMLHILLEAPFCIAALVSPESLPFLEMNNTSVLILKLYAGLVLSSILAAYLVSGLPEFLPGKRAVALQLCLYHTVAATALWHSPRFIPITLGMDAERIGITLERLWCVSHGLLSAALGIWWHVTIPYMVAMKEFSK